MTAKASGSRKLKRNKFPKFNNDIYAGISASNLIVYAVHYLLEQHIEVKLEDIVFACFLLFPHKFALKQFPRWPDSALVSRRLSDCRSKGYFAQNTDLGFKLTAKGSRLAEKTAKALGVFKVKRAVKAVRAQPKNQATSPAKKVKSLGAKAKVTKPVISSQPKVSSVTSIKKTKTSQKKKTTSSARIRKTQVSSSHASPAKQVQKAAPSTPIKNAVPVQRKKASTTITPVKKAAISEIKVQPAIKANKKHSIHKEKAALPKQVKKNRAIRTTKVSSTAVAVKQVKKKQAVQKEKTDLPAPTKQTGQPIVQVVRQAPAIPVSKPVAKERASQPAKPALPKRQWNDVVKKRLGAVVLEQQITPSRNVKPIAPVLARPVKAKKVQPEKVNFHTASPVTTEAKERAGKFTRMMERSDAYLHYKKHANNSKISEFDFRSLLLCTMESSPETLARNVELFKGYATINNRQDLTVFLNFCEDRFSYLLKAQNKPARKAKK